MKRILFVLAVTVLAVSAARAQGADIKERKEVLREPDPERRGEIIFNRSRVKLDELARTANSSRRADARTFEASVLINNRAAKTVKSVSWRVSLVDPDSGEVIRKYDITTEKRIAPGRRKKLTRRLPVPPPGSVSANARGGASSGTVADVVAVVTRVEYTDGTFGDAP